MLNVITSRTKARNALALASCAIAVGLGALASAGTAQAPEIAPATANIAQAYAGAPAASTAARSTPTGDALRARHAPPAVMPLDYQGCAAGFFCTADYEVTAPGTYQWTLPNYILHGGTYFLPYGECSPNDEPGCHVGVVSFANNTGYRVWLEQYQNSGNEYCISNHTSSDTFNSNVNHLDYWIYFSDNPAACS